MKKKFETGHKKEERKLTQYPRSGGWFYTEDGMNRLKEGGMKGHEASEKAISSQIGERIRVSKPLRKEAADILMSVNGFIERALFLNNAILAEAARRERKESK